MARGFGSTFGAGSTDAVTTRFASALSTTLSFSVWLLNDGSGGGGTFGRVFDVSNNNLFYADNTGNTPGTMEWGWVSSGTTPAWSHTYPADGRWHNIVGTWNVSTITTTPSFWMDGVTKLASNIAVGTGTAANTASAVIIGNRADGTRNWGGQIAHLAMWSGLLLSGQEAAALGQGINPTLIRPDFLSLYLPLDGVSKPEPDLILGNSSTVTGTRLGTSEPSCMNTYNKIPYLFEPTLPPIAPPASGVVFRRTYGGLGTRTGSRQAQG